MDRVVQVYGVAGHEWIRQKNPAENPLTASQVTLADQHILLGSTRVHGKVWVDGRIEVYRHDRLYYDTQLPESFGKLYGSMKEGPNRSI
jgi:hypothetical protein